MRASVVFFSLHRQEAPTGVGVNSPRAGLSYPSKPPARRLQDWRQGKLKSKFYNILGKPGQTASPRIDFPPSSALASASVSTDPRLQRACRPERRIWMIPVRHDAVEVDFDGQRARLRVLGMDVFDDHDLVNSLSQGLGLPVIGSNPAIPGCFLLARKSRSTWNGTAPSRWQKLKTMRSSSKALS